METLAVVAFRQPVIRAEVEAIRGVSCGEILQQLMSRDLIRVGGRSEELGRPYLYSTTKRFLQVFGLRSLDDLPQSARFAAAPVRMPPDAEGQVDLEKTPANESDVEEEFDVSVSVEHENHPHALQTVVESERLETQTVRMEDEDFDDDEYEYEDADEEEEDADEEYEYEEEDEVGDLSLIHISEPTRPY